MKKFVNAHGDETPITAEIQQNLDEDYAEYMRSLLMLRCCQMAFVQDLLNSGNANIVMHVSFVKISEHLLTLWNRTRNIFKE